jgi:transcription termination factor NusB
MEAPQKSNSWAPALIVIAIVMVIVFAYHGIYKMYWQFNDQDVKDYITEEVNKYPADYRAANYKQINDAVRSILRSRSEVKEVLAKAKAAGTPNEMELVHAAVMQCKAYGYLKNA